ncbi:MAG: hypothetical protein A07HR60_02191 [uncultured archaeon A07HR60]|nr:MAG: hypothetical protein A07HR60_02191 [uncultured archaeon A07HR60]
MDPEPPTVPDDDFAEWTRVGDSTEVLFDGAPVTVTGRTLRYESTTPGARDSLDRFFFATRLGLEPSVSPNVALTKLVRSGAADGFRDQLSERGFKHIQRVETRTIPVGDAEADLYRYRARCAAADGDISAEAMMAVWADDSYQIAGGGYPLTGDVNTARRELRRLIRNVR